MRKAVIITGSPHRQGHSALMVEYLSSFFPKDIEVKSFNSYEMEISPCYDCGFCAEKDGCAVNDGMDILYPAISEADFLIISTPVYFGSLPAPLKAVIDRFMRCYNGYFKLNKRPVFPKPKTGIILLSSGSENIRQYESAIYQLKLCFSVMSTKEVYSVVWSGTDKPDETKRQNVLDEIKSKALEIFY